MNHQEAVEQRAAERYLLGEFSPPERGEFEEHFFGCQECAGEVRAGAAFTANLRAVFEDEAAVRAAHAAGNGQAEQTGVENSAAPPARSGRARAAGRTRLRGLGKAGPGTRQGD